MRKAARAKAIIESAVPVPLDNIEDSAQLNEETFDISPVNCHKSNLRLVDKRVINITHHMQQNNTLGTVGVHYNHHHRNWNATWKDEQVDKHTKLFAVIKYGPARTKELAIQYRAYIERNLPHYAIALGINE